MPRAGLGTHQHLGCFKQPFIDVDSAAHRFDLQDIVPARAALVHRLEIEDRVRGVIDGQDPQLVHVAEEVQHLDGSNIGEVHLGFPSRNRRAHAPGSVQHHGDGEGQLAMLPPEFHGDRHDPLERRLEEAACAIGTLAPGHEKAMPGGFHPRSEQLHPPCPEIACRDVFDHDAGIARQAFQRPVEAGRVARIDLHAGLLKQSVQRPVGGGREEKHGKLSIATDNEPGAVVFRNGIGCFAVDREAIGRRAGRSQPVAEHEMVQALFQRPRTRRDPLAVSFQCIRSLQRIRGVDPCMDQEGLALRHGLRGVDGMDAQVPSRIPVQHAVVDGNIAQRRLPCRVQGIASRPLPVAQHEKPGRHAVGNQARAQLQRIGQPGLVATQI